MRAYLLLYIGTKHEWCGMIHLQTCIRQLSDTTNKIQILLCILWYQIWCEGWHFIQMWKLRDRITSLKGEVLAQKISLTPSLFIELVMPSQESEQSCTFMYVCYGYQFCLSVIYDFLLDFGPVQI